MSFDRAVKNSYFTVTKVERLRKNEAYTEISALLEKRKGLRDERNVLIHEATFKWVKVEKMFLEIHNSLDETTLNCFKDLTCAHGFNTINALNRTRGRNDVTDAKHFRNIFHPHLPEQILFKFINVKVFSFKCNLKANLAFKFVSSLLLKNALDSDTV